jgi:hypothetical protein
MEHLTSPTPGRGSLAARIDYEFSCEGVAGT